MSKWRYFVTEDDQFSRTGRSIKKAQELKVRFTQLESELKEFANSWMQLGHEGLHSHGRAFQIDEESLTVRNPTQSLAVILTVPWEHFDAEKIKHLFGDFQQTRDALTEAEKELRALGVSLAPEF
jgi:hypothetical protein